MAFQLKNGQGSMFENEYKKLDKHPDWKGDIMINGNLCSIAAWKKTSRGGKEFLSVQISPKQQQQAPQYPQQYPQYQQPVAPQAPPMAPLQPQTFVQPPQAGGMPF